MKVLGALAYAYVDKTCDNTVLKKYMKYWLKCDPVRSCSLRAQRFDRRVPDTEHEASRRLRGGRTPVRRAIGKTWRVVGGDAETCCFGFWHGMCDVD